MFGLPELVVIVLILALVSGSSRLPRMARWFVRARRELVAAAVLGEEPE